MRAAPGTVHARREAGAARSCETLSLSGDMDLENIKAKNFSLRKRDTWIFTLALVAHPQVPYRETTNRE